jgi:hypothetical protein
MRRQRKACFLAEEAAAEIASEKTVWCWPKDRIRLILKSGTSKGRCDDAIRDAGAGFLKTTCRKYIR